MSNENFKFISFESGLERIAHARKELGLTEQNTTVLTSRDPFAQRIRESLSIRKLPAGFQKWQLPFALTGKGAQFFISVAQAGAGVEEHLHEEGDGIRVIVSGSIEYAGLELTAGDWMFIPQNVPYAFNAGKYGATMFYCYACCCVPN
ncbi:cupin domain-containing protein [Janthinobacterium sp. GB4P2]|uniref:cupin domain-containing protein n=1 Tax=Janthinobacterium sp. GB4P2 TaxID=3424189 RepID=UPI003F20D340